LKKAEFTGYIKDYAIITGNCAGLLVYICRI